MLRILCLAGGLSGAALLSQYPAYSQQYLQRLAGQVDALTQVAQDFDASALAAGLGREAALQQMTGTPFLEARQADMRQTFARHARLSHDLMTLRNAAPLARMLMPHRQADRTTFAATFDDFQPALPLSTPGVVSAGGGFLAGWGGVALFFALLRAPFRPRNRGTTRTEPPIARQQPAPGPQMPRIGGVRR